MLGSERISLSSGREDLDRRASGRDERARPFSRHRRLGRPHRALRAPARARIERPRPSSGSPRNVATDPPDGGRRLPPVRERPGPRARRQSHSREGPVAVFPSFPGADLLGRQQLAYGPARLARRRRAPHHRRSRRRRDMAVLAAPPSRRLRAPLRRRQFLAGGGEPARVRRRRGLAPGVDRAFRRRALARGMDCALRRPGGDRARLDSRQSPVVGTQVPRQEDVDLCRRRGRRDRPAWRRREHRLLRQVAAGRICARDDVDQRLGDRVPGPDQLHPTQETARPQRIRRRQRRPTSNARSARIPSSRLGSLSWRSPLPSRRG